jgi:DNA-binding response OmpR family regulator
LSTRILVVDDSEITQKMLALHLIKSGYAVKGATDGIEAIKVTKQWDPSLILLDLMMPGMDGFATMRRLRDFSSIPIVILSAKGSEIDKVQGLNGGAADYLVKPFSSEELLARLRAVLRRSGTRNYLENSYRIFQHGDLLIDVNRTKVKVDGTEINLLTTEFNLLVTLASSMGKVLSHEFLLSKIWGKEYRSLNSMLDATIRNLREKIERNPHAPVHIISCDTEGYLMPTQDE